LQVRGHLAGWRILPMQTIRFDPFVLRAWHNLRRGPARLAGARSGATHPVWRFVAGDGQYLVDVGHAAKWKLG
jgi:hypothetical protein